MGKIKDALGRFLVWIGTLVIGVFAGIGGLLIWMEARERRDAKKRKDREDELRKMDAGAVIDKLDNAERVRDIIRGRAPDDDAAAGTTELHNPGIWGGGNIFQGRRVDST